MATTILVVDDSQVERLLVEGLLVKNPDYKIELAENGKEALEKLARMPVDLVVTDLVMPEMDGVQLVRKVRQRHPGIPVILMTAYDDQANALQAFEAGAASYVPKSRQAERMLETVARLVERSSSERSRAHLGECMLEYHCRFAIENDLRLIRALVDQVQQVMACQGFADTVERIRTGEALEEALLNAMYHGNLEIDERELAKARNELDERVLRRLIEERCRQQDYGERKILVVVHVTATEARFVIRDQGRGFRTTFAASGDKSDSFERGHHRGLTLIHSLMDDVSYNAAGNELTMRKRRRVAADEALSPSTANRS